MSRSEGAALLPLAESIVDGSVVDWEAAEARATTDEQAIIRQLRVLSNLAGLHRSLPRDARRSALQSSSPAIGTWAHLTLLARLGGGAFGEVYRAWDRHLERDVALKLLKSDESDDDLEASRIAAEGRRLARVRHPNVITVHGVDVHDRRVGLWMELVRGGTLEQKLQEHGPLSAREAALVGIDLCRALAAIHAAGLIHRDVKAQNVMREDGGRIVLMDLGTGRETDHQGGGAFHDLAGTPLYLAPEIFDGAAASEATDLYSLGVLLYHLVTGAFPVRATSLEELKRGHRNGRAVRLRDARAELPTAFVQVIDKAIATDPSRRFASAGALESDLVATLDAPVDHGGLIDEGDAPHARRRLLLALLAVGTVLAIAVAIFAGRWSTPPDLPASATGPIGSIAVLPLVNLSGDSSLDYFSDGMTDELIGAIGEIRGLRVISRTSVMQLKSSKKTAPEIARALHVDALLEGAVNIGPRADDGRPANEKRVRLSARLIHAGTDTQIWDRTFEAVAADVLAIRSEVAKAVADGVHMRHAALVERPAQDFDSFDLYLKGRYYWNARTEESLKRSIQYFEEAVDRSPRFARAYAGIADAYNLLGEYGFISRAEAREHAVAAARKALELDESVAEAYVSLAFIDDDEFQWDAAETRFKRAVTLKPGYVTAHHWYAYHLVQRARFDEAIAEGTKAVELDPLSIGTNGELGAIFLYARRYDRAITQLEKTVQMDPKFARGHSELAKAFLLNGDGQRGRAAADRAAALAPRDVIALGDIGYVYAMTGRQKDARDIATQLAARYRLHEDGAALATATVYAGLGDLDRTFTWLEATRRPLDPQLAAFKIDPRFERVRQDPRFGKLLATVGLAQ